MKYNAAKLGPTINGTAKEKRRDGNQRRRHEEGPIVPPPHLQNMGMGMGMGFGFGFQELSTVLDSDVQIYQTTLIFKWCNPSYQTLAQHSSVALDVQLM